MALRPLRAGRRAAAHALVSGDRVHQTAPAVRDTSPPGVSSRVVGVQREEKCRGRRGGRLEAA